MGFTGQLGTANSTPGNVVPGWNGVARTSRGVRVGSTFLAVPYVASGFSAGSVFTGTAPFVQTEVQVGGAFAATAPEIVSTGVQVGGEFTPNPPLRQGFTVGSIFSVPIASGGLLSEGAMVGSVFTSDSGDLANGRYRR